MALEILLALAVMVVAARQVLTIILFLEQQILEAEAEAQTAELVRAVQVDQV